MSTKYGIIIDKIWMVERTANLCSIAASFFLSSFGRKEQISLIQSSYMIITRLCAIIWFMHTLRLATSEISWSSTIKKKKKKFTNPFYIIPSHHQ